MKTFKTPVASLGLLLAPLNVLLLCLSAAAAPVTYPGPQATDTAGVVVTSGVTASVTSVTDLDGGIIASPGAVAHVAGPNVSVVYDAAAKGEAWVGLTITATGHTFATVYLYCSADPQALAAANTGIAGVPSATWNVTNRVVTGVSGPVTGTLTGNLIGSISGNVQGGVFGSVGGNVNGSVNSVALPVSLSTGDEAKVAAIGTDSPGVGTLLTRLGTPTGASIDADILSRLAASGYTAPPSDYQQRGVAVTLPSTAPAGYGGSGGGGMGPTAVAIRQEIDANSTQLASLVTSQAVQSAAIAALPSASAIASAVLGASIDGTVTLKQAEALALAVNAGHYAIAALNTTSHTKAYTYYRQDGTTLLATSTVTYAIDNVNPVSRSVVFSNLP